MVTLMLARGADIWYSVIADTEIPDISTLGQPGLMALVLGLLVFLVRQWTTAYERMQVKAGEQELARQQQLTDALAKHERMVLERLETMTKAMEERAHLRTNVQLEKIESAASHLRTSIEKVEKMRRNGQ
jgi:uncharacterized membrane protein (DUF106 family)